MKHRVPPVLAATVAMLGAVATTAAAHPGHGLETDGVGLVHFLLQPSHGGIAAVAALALVAASIVVKRRRHG
jgi:hypothetical protein